MATHTALRRRLVGLAGHWLGDGSMAEDLVQDAYLRTADGALPGSAGSQEAWLVTVLRNLCIDHWRRQVRYHAVLEQLAEPWSVGFDGGPPEQLAAQAQRVDEALQKLVHHLPADDVAALLLYEVFGFSHAELGALSGRSEAASRQRLHRMTGHLDRPAPAGLPEDEDRAALFALCQQALTQCETAALVAVIRAARPQGMAVLAQAQQVDLAFVKAGPSTRIVHHGSQLALLVQTGHGPVACIPLGEPLAEAA
jgi:RNA polymerase sigma-70 factor (ECF subfamily)